MHLTPFRRLLPILVPAVALVAATACGEERPRIGDGPYAELVGEFVPKIEQALGVPFKSPPVVEQRTRAEVAAFVRQQLESERARTQLAGQEALYKILGIIPDTMDLAPMLQRLLGRDVRLVSAGHAIAAAVQRTLARAGALSDTGHEGEYSFLVTGDVESFVEVGSRFLQLPLVGRVERVTIP